MATDVEQLVVKLGADIRVFRSEMLKAQGINAKAARDVENTWSRTNSKLNGYGRSMAQGLIAPLSGIAAAASVREVAAYADAWTTAGNKLAAAGQVAGRQARTLEGINQIANDTRTGISETADLYAKLLRSTKDVAKSEEEVARATAITNKAFKAGGAAAGEQAAGILQLSQALGSGVLQGDELRSLRENAPLLAQAIADEFKTTIGGLKQLGADGELTSARVFKAILNAQPKIEAAFAVTNQTIGEGVTKINNAFTQYIGQSDASLGATGRLTQGLSALADNFDSIADTTLKLAAIIAGALVGRSIAGMIVKLGLGTAAIYRFVAALTAARGVVGVATAIGGLGAAAGPVGAIVGTVLTGALIAFGTRSGEASDAATAYANALDEVKTAAGGAAEAVDNFEGKKRADAAGGVAIGESEIKRTRQEAAALFKEIIDNAPRRLVTPEQLKQLQELQAGLAAGTTEASAVSDALYALAEADPKFKKLADQLQPLLEGLESAAKATEKLKGGLSNLGSSVIPDGRGQETAALAADRATAKFLSDRDAEAKRTEQQKKIDTRTDSIIAAAEKAGVALTEAAARIKAAGEIAAEDLATSTAKSVGSAADLIKQKEGFRAKPYFDVNAYRAGYGSDTVTLSDGSIQKVTQGMTVTLEEANRDLERRIGEFQDGIKGAIGADAFNAMTEQQQAVLTSIAYNYGSLPDRIIKAIATGDAGAVYTAIRGLGSDNGGVNRNRRNEEAAMFAAGGGAGITGAVTAGEGQDNFAKKLEEQRQYIEALQAETGIRAQLNPLVNDYGLAMTAVEVAQQLLTEAQKEGIEAGLELSDVQQLLYGDLSGLSPVAREQALAMRELALSTGTAKAEGEMLAESQKNLADSMRASSEFGKDLLGGFIRDLREGKSATEALSNALGKVADKLLDMALNSLFDGVGGAGSGGGILGGLFGGIGKLFGFASGTANTGGRRGEPRGIVHGQEAVIPLNAGGKIPIQMPPAGPVGRAANDNVHVTVGVSADSAGNLTPFVESVTMAGIKKAAPHIVRASVAEGQKLTKANMPSYMNNAQTRQM